MTKRYVFWRSPTGSPYRGTDERHSPSVLLEYIGKNSSLQSDGTVQWTWSGFHQAELALYAGASIIDPDGRELGDEIVATFLWSAVVAAIKKSGGGKVLKASAVLQEADAITANHFRQPLNHFVMLTALSVKSLPSRSIRTTGCKIAALSSVKRFKYPPVLQDALSWAPAERLKPNIGQSIKVEVAARSVAEAADFALHSLNLVRGLWTLSAIYGKWTMRWSVVPKHRPVGVIRIGPIHTLHLLNGEPAGDLYWYERQQSHDAELFDPGPSWSKIEKARKWAIRKLRNAPYRSEVENLIVRYVTALDNTDHDVAFLQMWSLLEKVTSTIGANYDETIKRATWGFKDRSFKMQLLDSLRLYRNQYVHSARTGDNREQMLHMI